VSIQTDRPGKIFFTEGAIFLRSLVVRALSVRDVLGPEYAYGRFNPLQFRERKPEVCVLSDTTKPTESTNKMFRGPNGDPRNYRPTFSACFIFPGTGYALGSLFKFVLGVIFIRSWHQFWVIG
jgi:hypothetical protein